MKKKIKIAILGTRGIPNNYGGFEQFAEYLSIGLVKKGHEITVYNSHSHPYQKDEYNGVSIKHIYDPEIKMGTAGQFIYDLLCILHTRKTNYDIILQLGYTSSSIFFSLHSNQSLIVTNMDGLEWKRTKYSKKVQTFLKWAEFLAVKKSDFLISDSIGIQNYIKNKYNKNSKYIPYGAFVIDSFSQKTCKEFKVEKYKYDMLIARLEPENNIEMILDGVVHSKIQRKFLVIGNHKSKYGEYLKIKFKENLNIIFVGGLYSQSRLDNLRCFSNIYFHGHSTGGTNPSLLEAMASHALICANNNEFNCAILGEDALYFNNINDVISIIKKVEKRKYFSFIQNNIKKINDKYKWEIIIAQYEYIFFEYLENN